MEDKTQMTTKDDAISTLIAIIKELTINVETLTFQVRELRKELETHVNSYHHQKNEST